MSNLFWPGFILGTVNAIGLAALIWTFVEYCECLT